MNGYGATQVQFKGQTGHNFVVVKEIIFTTQKSILGSLFSSACLSDVKILESDDVHEENIIDCVDFLRKDNVKVHM